MSLALIFHPYLSIRILSSAFSHTHFSIRILSSAFFYPPSAAIRSALYRDPKVCGRHVSQFKTDKQTHLLAYLSQEKKIKRHWPGWGRSVQWKTVTSVTVFRYMDRPIRDVFSLWNNMLFSRVKISCFRAKAHLVFNWCLYNKKLIHQVKTTMQPWLLWLFVWVEVVTCLDWLVTTVCISCFNWSVFTCRYKSEI